MPKHACARTLRQNVELRDTGHPHAMSRGGENAALEQNSERKRWVSLAAI